MSAAIHFIRMTNSVLSPVAPGASGWVAKQLFTTPRRYDPPAREQQAERNGERVRFGSGLSALRFGWGGGPRVLAMHGWEGRATQWGSLARALTAAGFELVAIDAPGHGRSPGRHANPATFTGAMLAADAEFGPFVGVVGHSMGGAATGFALDRGLRAQRAVFVASPASPIRMMHNFAGWIGLNATARARFFEQMERSVGLPPEAFDLLGLELEQDALVIHSRDDKTVEFANAEKLVGAWSDARLLELDGLGHNRVMRAEPMIDAAVEFLGSVRA